MREHLRETMNAKPPVKKPRSLRSCCVTSHSSCFLVDHNRTTWAQNVIWNDPGWNSTQEAQTEVSDLAGGVENKIVSRASEWRLCDILEVGSHALRSRGG